MIPSEAHWLGRALQFLADDDLFPLLNVGSQDAAFRTRRQPWMERHVFAPLRDRGGQVVHLDLEPGDGVDVAGDLLAPETHAAIAGRFRSILCANVLEHVTDRQRFAAVLSDVLPHGGYLIVTCPRAFPYHPDPIDTMFRPDPAELAALFPGLTRTEDVIVRGTMLGYVLARALEAPRDLLQAASRPRSGGGPSWTDFLAWLPRRIETSCVVMRKER